MNNSSQALIIAGVILVAILIVVIGMYIYNSSAGNVTDALSTYTTEEINSFNSQYEIFKGEQRGSNLTNLVNKLIANANTNKENLDKIPDFLVNDKINMSGDKVDAKKTDDNSDLLEYIQNLGTIKQKIESKHTYTIELKYSTTGYISEFLISY